MMSGEDAANIYLKGRAFSCLLEGEEVDDDGLLKGEG